MEIDVASDGMPNNFLFRTFARLRASAEQQFTIRAIYPDQTVLTMASLELRTACEEEDLLFIDEKAREMMEAQLVTIERVSNEPQTMMPEVEYVPQE